MSSVDGASGKETPVVKGFVRPMDPVGKDTSAEDASITPEESTTDTTYSQVARRIGPRHRRRRG